MLWVSSHARPIATICLVWLAGAVPARAQDTSAWDVQSHATARLLAGALIKKSANPFVRAGLEIQLQRGWKTYWRYPGDSGIPPSFDFQGSENVKSVRVEWPAPEPFSDEAGGHSIGYAGDIILPLRVIPEDAAKPISLHVVASYAICGTLCVPAKAKLTLMLNGKGADEPILETAEQRVPKRAPLGAVAANQLAILSVHRETGANDKLVSVEVSAPPGAPVELFAEGPTPDWALPLPEPAGAENGGKRRFTFMLDGLPPGAHAKGAILTLTAVSGGKAIEVPVHLD